MNNRHHLDANLKRLKLSGMVTNLDIRMQEAGENVKFLPGYKLPETLVFEADDKRIMLGADLVVSAVPCQFMRSVWGRLKEHLPSGVPIVSVAKGIEIESLFGIQARIPYIFDIH